MESVVELENILNQAQQALAQGDFEEAKNLYHLAINLQPQCAVALHQLGVITAQYGQYSEAQSYLQAALALLPDDPILHSHFANVLLAQQTFDLAEQHYRTAIRLAPTNPDPHNNLGNLFVKQQRWDQAEQCYLQAIACAPYHHDAQYNLGRLYVAQEKFAQARSHLIEAYQSIPNHIPTLLALGMVHEHSQAIDQAIHCFSSVLAIEPQQVVARQHLAVCFLSQERYEEAKEHYETLLGLTPYDPMVSYNLAVIATVEQQFSDAINYYKASLQLDPQSVAAHINIANLYLGFSDEPRAIAHFQAVLALEPENTTVLFRLAAITQQQQFSAPPKAYVQGLFDYYAPRYERDLQVNLHYQVPTILQQWLEKCFAGRQDVCVMDLGCGTGLCGEIAKPYAKRLVGVDLSSKMLIKAREKNIYDHLWEGDIVETLSLLHETFDCLLAGDVLSYYGDLQPVMSAVQRVVHAKTWFLFTTEQAAEGVEQYQLCKTSRYAHSEQYIMDLAKAYQFAVVHHESITLREQNHQPVVGNLFVLRSIVTEH